MTYNVFGGTLSITQSVSPAVNILFFEICHLQADYQEMGTDSGVTACIKNYFFSDLMFYFIADFDACTVYNQSTSRN